MKGKGMEGLPVVHRTSRAANDDFAGSASDLDKHARPRPGWDPYEVWRVRVRGSVDPGDKRERDPHR